MSQFDIKNRYELTNKLFIFLENCDSRQIVEFIKDRKVDVNLVLRERGIAPIHYAVGCNPQSYAEHMTKLFLQYGADPNVRSDEGLTPLHISALWGRNNILYLLLVNGGNPFLTDVVNKNAIHYAQEYKRYDTLGLLKRFQYFDSVVTENCNIPRYTLTLDKVFLRHNNNVTEFEVEKEPNRADLPPVKTVPFWKSFSKNFFALDALKSAKNRFHVTLKACKCEKDKNSTAENINDTFLRFSEIRNETCDEDEEEEDIISQLLNLHVNSQDCSKVKKQISLSDSVITSDCHLENRLQSDEKENTDSAGQIKDVNKNENVKNSSVTEIRQTIKIAAPGCEEIRSVVPTVSEGQEAVAMPSDTETSALYITCEENEVEVLKDMTEVSKDMTEASKDMTENLTFSVAPNADTSNICDKTLQYLSEEYIYTDIEDGSSLLERCIYPGHIGSDSSLLTSDNTLTSEVMNIDSDTLRSELIKSGCSPGPITSTTKRVYLKKLVKVQKMPIVPQPKKTFCRVYSPELTQTLKDPVSANRFIKLERDISEQFSNPDIKHRWREGNHKSSFTYLLLDPRVTNNLPGRFHDEDIPAPVIWNTFLDSIFYVGKGKSSRPYSHLKDAISAQKSSFIKCNKKIRHILSIWQDDLGVICVQVFHNIIPVDAYTREAAMIDALGLSNLDNEQRGEYYGKASVWSEKEKRRLGVYLLYKTLYVYLSEGERQLRPVDIN